MNVGRRTFPLRAAFASALVAGAGFYAQIALRTALSEKSQLSPDAILAVSFGVEAAFFLAAGLLCSFIGRGFALVAQAVSALFLALAAFGVLRAIKPPSFSYDRFFAGPGEIAVWAGLTGLACWLLGLWGASAGVLLGARGKPDLSFSYEIGIARTHLRLTRGTLASLAALGLVPPGVLFGAGVLASAWFKTAPVDPARIGVGVAAGLAALFVVGSWVARRVRLARLLPGQRKRRPATAVMTAISIAGVALGVWALTVVLSVMSGFEADLKKKILGTNSHAYLMKHTSDFSEWKAVESKVAGVSGVVGVTPFIQNEVMISESESLTGAELKGIDPSTVGSVSDLPKQVIAGEMSWITSPELIPSTPVKLKSEKAAAMGDLEDYQIKIGDRRASHPEEGSARRVDAAALLKMPGLCLGKEMSAQLRVWVGDVVNVITPLGDIGPTGPVPRSRAFRVACILYSGMYEYDSKFAYIAIGEAQRFFRLGNNITGLELKFRDVDAARALSRRVVATLGGYPYRAKDWAELNRNLFSALKLEKLAMWIILTFIVLVACFNILSTLIMLVLEKTKEISILMSMGARDASVMKIFVIEGLTIGAIGTVMGLLLGIASCSFIERYGLRLDPDVYYISNLPVNADGAQFGLVACVALALSYLATLYPSIKASRLSPVDGLRED
ncbi:MAG TPA: FtsX-like permease family protein [Myxococcales bacterium]|nr:FtsX-like permease family protein [Myxococcales bacterium]